MLLDHGLSLATLARSMGRAFPFYGVSLADPPSLDGSTDLIPAVAERLLPELRAVLPAARIIWVASRAADCLPWRSPAALSRTAKRLHCSSCSTSRAQFPESA